MKPSWKSTLALALVLVLGLTTLAGCGSTPPPPPPVTQSQTTTQSAASSSQTTQPQQPSGPTETGEGELRLYESRELETLNPHAYSASATKDFLELCVGLLYRYVPNGEGGYGLDAELATGEPKQMDADGKVWQVQVRSDGKWANGETITAEDFVYSWLMLIDPSLVNEQAMTHEEYSLNIAGATAYLSNKEGATLENVGIRLVGSDTIELTLENAVTPFIVKNALCAVTMGLVYKPMYEAGMNAERTETDYGTSVDKFMSSGPFMVDIWQSGADYGAVKNPQYIYSGDIWLAKISYRVLKETGTALQLFESGQLDCVGLSEANFQQYKDDPRVWEQPATSVQRIAINAGSTDKPILQNVKFRQALNYATNREEIARMTNSLPANYIIPVNYFSDVEAEQLYRDTPEGQAALLGGAYGYDPDLAKTLFDEAMSEAGITSIELQLDYHEGNESRKLGSEYLQSTWAQIFGEDRIKITLQAVPSSQLSAKLRGYVDDVNSFELGWTGSSFNIFDAASILQEFYVNTPRRKGPCICPEFDALYEQLSALPLSDTQARLKIMAQAEKVLLDDASFIPGTQGVSKRLISTGIELPVSRYYETIRYGFAWAKVK